MPASPPRHDDPAAPRPAPVGTVPSPCTGVCRIDARHGLCAGCLRSLDEIAAWPTLDDPARLALRRRLRARRAQGVAALEAAPNASTSNNSGASDSAANVTASSGSAANVTAADGSAANVTAANGSAANASAANGGAAGDGAAPDTP